MGEKPIVSIKLKDNKPFYFEDERIQVTINLQLKKLIDGKDGGKIKYTVEIRLGSTRFFKKIIRAKSSIALPLVAKVDIDMNGLEKQKETSISWPQEEKDEDMYVLSASIPHEGWLLGTTIDVEINLKQPKIHVPVESLVAELICQESIASVRDRVPETTWQLDDRIVEKYSLKGEILASTQIITLPIPSNLTPTISSLSAKVMRLDYKLRVTVELQNRNRVLSVNLPLVIGTKRTFYQKPAVEDLDSSNHETHQSNDPNLSNCAPNSFGYYFNSPEYYPHPFGLSGAKKRTCLSSVRSTLCMSPYFSVGPVDSPSYFQSSSTRSLSLVYPPHQQPSSPAIILGTDSHNIFPQPNLSPMQCIPEDTSNNRNASRTMGSPFNKYLFTNESYAQTFGLLQQYQFSLEKEEHSNQLEELSCDSLYLEAIEENSIIISLSEFIGMKFKSKNLNLILREHFPNGLGLRARHVNKELKHIEINFGSAAERDEALTKKLVIFNKTIRISRPLDKDTTVIRVEISNIPMQSEDLLKSHMIDIFKQYGEILKIGIYRVTDGGWFTGKGFVTLRKHKSDLMYHQLAPQITSWKANTKLHLAYLNISTTCKYCHGDHNKSKCPMISAKKRACFQCGSPGHLKANCPLASWNQRKNTKVSAGSLSNNTTSQDLSVPELYESDIQSISMSGDSLANSDDDDTIERTSDNNHRCDLKKKRYITINNICGHIELNKINTLEVD
ncbi:hypothetical protein INT47_004474 [Mucor saturninus]|uniref:CCHC-type domain-containing protein n=1 Tax=Mucor saturninus TaxID=64648 RepID=A0A8H7UR12_9FUNG|nr:hypothetical protein INT47_004474 [Mucor saturninus]